MAFSYKEPINQMIEEPLNKFMKKDLTVEQTVAQISKNFWEVWLHHIAKDTITETLEHVSTHLDINDPDFVTYYNDSAEHINKYCSDPEDVRRPNLFDTLKKDAYLILIQTSPKYTADKTYDLVEPYKESPESYYDLVFNAVFKDPTMERRITDWVYD